jgi:hypothetical protein
MCDIFVDTIGKPLPPTTMNLMQLSRRATFAFCGYANQYERHGMEDDGALGKTLSFNAKGEWHTIPSDDHAVYAPRIEFLRSTGVVLDRGHPPRSRVNTGLEPTASAIWAEPAPDGGVLHAWHCLHLSSSTPAINAQRAGQILPLSHP